MCQIKYVLLKIVTNVTFYAFINSEFHCKYNFL